MSINQIILDNYKPWLNARVNNLTVDGNFNAANNSVEISDLESSGNVGFLHDNGSDVNVKNIEIGDLQNIGVGATNGQVLTYDAGNVFFDNVGSGGSVNIYNDNGFLDANRTLNFNNFDLTFVNSANFILSNSLTVNNSEDIFMVRNSSTGVIESREKSSITINIPNLISSGGPGVLFDDGTNIATSNNITLGALTAVSLTGSNLIILNNPPINNTIDSVLVRNNTGEIDRREISSFEINIPNLISSGGSGVLYDNGASVSTSNNINIDSIVTDTLGTETLTILTNPPIDNTGDSVLARNNTGGIVRTELSSFPFLTNQTVETFAFNSVHYVLGNPTVDIQFMQTGRMVTAYFLIPLVASGLDIDYIILTEPFGFPDRLKPVSETISAVTVLDGTYKPGIWKMTDSGVMNIGLAPIAASFNPGDFSAGQTRGTLGLYVTYIGQP